MNYQKAQLLLLFILLIGMTNVMGQCPNPLLYDLTFTNTSSSPYWKHCIDNASDPDSFNLDLISPANIENYTINFGDGKSTSGVFWAANTSITHKYGLGKFTIILTETQNGCTKTITGTLINDRKPGAAALPPTLGSSGCVPKSLSFKNITSNTSIYTQFEWKWGDGTKEYYDETNLGKTVSHTYKKGTSGCNMKVRLTSYGLCDTSFAEYGPYDFWDIDTAAIYATDTVICRAEYITFQDVSEYNCNITQPRKIQWDLSQVGGPVTGWLAATAANRTNKYFISGPPGSVYTVFLADSNICGVDRTAIKVRITAPPKAKFTISKDSICKDQSVTFTNLSTGGATDYIWDFGDGSPQLAVNTTASQTHQYTLGGTFFVTLKARIKNSTICADSQVTKVVVVPLTVPDFTINQNTLCGTASVTFTDNSSPDVYSWNWNLGNGVTKSGKGPWTFSLQPSLYYVTLKTGNILNCQSTASKAFNIFPAITVDMKADTVCEDFVTTFTDNSSINYGGNCGVGYIIRNQYDKIGGVTVANLTSNSSYPNNPTSTSTLTNYFESPQNIGDNYGARIQGLICPPVTGNYTFWIAGDDAAELWLGAGADSSVISKIAFNTTYTNYREWTKFPTQQSTPIFLIAGQRYFIMALQKENGGGDNLSVGWQLPNGTMERPIPASRLSPYEDGNVIKSWSWNFGDGSSAVVQNPTHKYHAGGVYSVKLTLNTNKCTNTNTFNVKVNPKPVADFKFKDTIGCTPFDPVITNITTGGSTYKWNFGDGTISSNQNPSHQFVNSGSVDQKYIIDLVAISSQGCSDTIDKKITVHPGVNPDFTYTPGGPQCTPVDFTFYNTTSGSTPATFKWYIGKDSFITNDATLKYKFYNNTQFLEQDTARLVAITTAGCKKEIKRPLLIFPTSDIKINTPPQEGCDPLKVDFTSSGNASIYNWDFGDGAFSNVTNPSHTFYNTSGKDTTFKVRLIAFNAFLCSDTSYTTVIVHPKPTAANFAALPSSIRIPDTTITITNFTTGTWQYNWDFGDGTTSNLKDPSLHNYYTPGNYAIKLIVSAHGCSDTTMKTITVLPGLPVAKITGYKSFCPPLDVNFNLSFKFSDTAIVDFGDGTNQKIYQPFPATFSHTYTTPGKYVSKVTAIGPGGVTTVANDSMVWVQTPPDINFGLSPSEIKLPDSTLYLTNNTLGTWNYHWDFGDGSLSNLQDPIKHYYNQPGTYSIKLVADGNGCTNSLTKTIKVLPPPPVAHIGGYGTSCPPLNVNFNLNFKFADTAIVDFGDGFIKKIYQPFPASIAHTYNTSGNYVSKLTAIGPGGVTTVANDSSIAVLSQPNVNFTLSPSQLKLPDTTLYITNTTSGPWDYHWDFGDGKSSTSKDPQVHYYDEDGTYTIKLIADGYGCYNSTSKLFNVLPPPPAAKISGHGKYCPPLTVNFNVHFKFSDTATVDFGDGTIKNIYQPFPSSLAHTYTSPGKYVAKLTAKGPGGVTSVVNDSIIWIQTPPDVNFTFSPTDLKLPDTTLYFTNNTIGNWQYQWDFGDGETSNQDAPVNHYYYEPGTYNIRLIAQGNGCADTLTKPLNVLPGPPVAKVYGHGHGCSPMEVPFNLDVKFADTIWVDFGDGNKKRYVKPFPISVTHVYLNPDKYIVKLTAKGPGGSYTVINDSIIDAASSPIANFAIKPKVIELNQSTFFSNSSKYAATYWWDFGDGTTSTEKMVFHTYKNAGLYDVTLVAINSTGCTDTLKLVAAVEVNPDAIILIPNAFTPSLAGPNGGNVANNGLNDVFYPLTENLTELNMLIFNRWGELIFESNDSNIGWDGYLKGKLCKEDVYVYKIKGKTAGGAQKEFVGDVTLIHKH